MSTAVNPPSDKDASARGRDEVETPTTSGDPAPLDRRDVVARQKEQFGGMKFGSAFFGWLAATGMAVLLTALVAGAGTATGVALMEAYDAAGAASARLINVSARSAVGSSSGGTLIAKSITEPGTYTGVYPFAAHRRWMRNAARLRHLSLRTEQAYLGWIRRLDWREEFETLPYQWEDVPRRFPDVSR